MFTSPLRTNKPQGIFLSFNQRERKTFPDCCSIRIYCCTDGRDIIGIHCPGDTAVLGVDVADGYELRLDRTEDRHGLGAFQWAASNIQSHLGGDAATVHHAIEGTAGVRRFDIEAGPLDPVLSEVAQKRNAVDGESVCGDGGLPPYRNFARHDTGDSPPDTSLAGELCQLGQSPCHEISAAIPVNTHWICRSCAGISSRRH